MPYKYIGRTTNFKGKTLWEIVGNLKNFGIGRIVARSVFEAYPEPSYIKIVKVETLPEPPTKSVDDVRKVKVWVERIFRGKKDPKIRCIESVSYKADYKLIPKDEEEAYCKFESPVEEAKIVPRTVSFPPLMREIILRERKAKGEDVTAEPELEVVYTKHGKKYNFKIAEGNETPNVEIVADLGTPIAPTLYKGIKL